MTKEFFIKLIRNSDSKLINFFIKSDKNYRYSWSSQFWQKLFSRRSAGRNQEQGYNYEISHLEVEPLKGLTLKSDQSSQVGAWCVYGVDKIQRSVHLLKILCPKSYRGRGHGKKLLISTLKSYAKAGFRTCFLEVSHDNKAAVSLYQSVGFTVYHKQKNFYSDGADALKMKLDFGTLC